MGKANFSEFLFESKLLFTVGTLKKPKKPLNCIDIFGNETARIIFGIDDT